MGKTLYLECSGGISGDMTVGALLDLGADQQGLMRALSSLPVDGFSVDIKRVKVSGLDACDFDVVPDSAHENHDHDMEYLYGHLHGNTCGGGAQGEPPDHPHHHDHTHSRDGGEGEGREHCHDEHVHEHRGLADIREIIEGSQLSARARETSLRIFTILAEAEARVHGSTPEEVHFHEVGAVDSIADIVAAAYCLDDLDIDECIVRELAEGNGTIRCAHGILPIPVPAVAAIAQAHRLRLHITEAAGEYVTPTGAAIAAAVRTSDRLPESFVIEAVGMGAGKRRQELSGLLRAMIIREEGSLPAPGAERSMS